MESAKTENNGGRLASLDILRGFDIFMLVAGHTLIYRLFKLGVFGDGEFSKEAIRQLGHCDWIGFTVWDMVMPLFVFMAGAAIPFALEKYATPLVFYKRLLKRVALLWILGMVVQGRLLAFDLHKLAVYSNTLQAIAVGYAASAVIFYHCRKNWIRLAIAGVIFVIYWVGFAVGGDFTKTGNFAEIVDCKVLGRWRDLVQWSKDGTWKFNHYYSYTWVWSSLGFILSALAGAFSGQLLKGEKSARRAYVLLGAGLLALGAAWGMSHWVPIIKKIWTPSMAIWAAGWSALLLGAVYWLVDIKGWIKGLGWLKIYGMNCIFAYVVAHVVNFRSVVCSFIFGVEQYVSKGWFDYLVRVGSIVIVFLLLYWLYRNRKFIRV